MEFKDYFLLIEDLISSSSSLTFTRQNDVRHFYKKKINLFLTIFFLSTMFFIEQKSIVFNTFLKAFEGVENELC